MASFDLVSFDPTRDLQVIAAIESPSKGILQLGFWVNDHLQSIIWQDLIAGHPRHDHLWESTCFELFIGVKDEDFYREINLGSNQAWQAYQFEEYRYPEHNPPLIADDIELIQLQRTKFGLTATIDLNLFLHAHQLKIQQIFIGLSAVIRTRQDTHYFAMKHSSPHADFHNKRDWLYQL